FFRDQHPFASLVEEVVPTLRKGRDTLSIWNGACSSGQESYTLAIILQEHFPDLSIGKRLRIVSTDVSPEMVGRCRKGEYSRFEVNRGLPTDLAVKYFDQAGRNWVAKKELRQLIETREMNLLQPWHGLGKCDLVLMRNVLIYFTPSVKSDILRRIRSEVLAPHGCLLLGASESTIGLDDGYDVRHVGNSTFNFLKASS
ncbi:MAG: protein-glutamate O-methyltransferase CheR, partial [Acidimicrobiales bacterium]